MRILFVFLVITGVALLTVGAVIPELFVLALLGMLVLMGTASVALAGMHQPRPPSAHY